MRFALAAVEVDGDSVQLRRFAVVVVNRLLLVNCAVLVAPGQRFATHAQHVVVRKRDIAIQVVADDAIGADLPIGIVAVSINRVLAVVARVRLVRQPGVVLQQLFVVGVNKAIAVNNLVAVELVGRNQLACAVVTVQSLGIVFVVGDRVQRPVCVVNVAVTQFKRAPAAVSTRRLGAPLSGGNNHLLIFTGMP